jgi:four helix bundle protein
MTEKVQRFAFQQRDVYEVALRLATVVHAAAIANAELRDQATRAVDSVFLNLSEGLPSQAVGVRRRHFTAANGSLHEVVAAVDLAAAIGAIAPEPAEEAQALALRVKQMLWRLISPARAG